MRKILWIVVDCENLKKVVLEEGLRLLQKSRQTLENTKVFVGVLSITSCIELYRFTLGYDL